VKRFWWPVMVAVVGLASAACGGDDGGGSTGIGDSATTRAEGTIVVTDAWARSSPTMANAGAVYMTIENTGGADDALVDVSVDPSVAASAELHEVVMADDTGGGMSSTTMGGGMGGGMSSTTSGDGVGDGAMSMQEVDRIDLPAGGSVDLEPGAYHVMLVDLAAPLEAGTTIAITLDFEHAGMFAVDAEVRVG
jgi:hypothetical protein